LQSLYTVISIKVVHEQSGKVEYERERLLGIANKLMDFQSGSQQPFFTGIYFFLPRSKISLTCKLSIIFSR
jgi:hypothetical protein